MKTAMLLASVALVTPFMPWKTVKIKDAEGKEVEAVEIREGNPVWVDTNGAESVLAGDTVSRLNKEAADNRKRAEKAEDSLKAFEGLDPAKAKAALDTVGKLDQKQLMESGEVTKLTQQIEGQFTEKLTAAEQANQKLRADLNNTRLDNLFGTSKFIGDKVALPPDVLRAYVGANFSFDDNGKLIIKDASGNQVFSKAKIGEPADFEEGLALLIESNPNKDAILKGNNHQGSGNNGGGGGGKPGQKTYRRAEIDAMSTTNAAGAAAAMAEVQAGTAQLVE